ncbi:MAG: enoyl-CoA hydratase/isomerase family protein [Hydrogenophaga sp.]|uniref:enoyl-CoA hydratase/isomerase family protein n=1 Tax=Hydrogenophaga sp. TaxID=1904254 RepID=UPI00169882D3|nr:enoyl-CoA hydratase/isomerase family protein [Hydrogenophaga sp.]NIM40172.1 enoyl-CoA hydratase/isomerase family protein [Hydrogenophaga sp.]NIN25406.1 enoyl-CoA hydratase/isomerase family protein [Hydrogenophaga sp.]NIN32263.1 enoyl-CoA hydratase/isomerase family protein [Hydrogenophaga sp.]NIN56512.1 enoyl-CoA hydratase/isomerase family protein [Hydrogenophaga sp.]NIO52821.1 enoyl-CoA hydratase/isomerase family protein [Hydrogenophaga sp.]
MSLNESLVIAEVQGRVGLITLNRPKALNALSLGMIRDITAALQAWREDPAVFAVAIRGMGKEGPFGAFCAGGDIRFFHQAALAGDPALEDFFTEEYALNHLIHTYPKPYIAFMDGICMGGGMGISQGASLRVVTERSKLAMPETNIGLFPDVGGGYFLSRCAGHVGEYLGLTGRLLQGREALSVGLADGHIEAQRLPKLWDSLAATPFENGEAVQRWVESHLQTAAPAAPWPTAEVNAVFGLDDVKSMVAALEASGSDWAKETLHTLRQRSPLMLHVVLEQIRRARGMGLADDLRMERDLVHHCFHLRPGAASETVEGVRALAIDKDHAPKWNPARIEDVTAQSVAAFFESPWTAQTHPLRSLG